MLADLPRKARLFPSWWPLFCEAYRFWRVRMRYGRLAATRRAKQFADEWHEGVR